MTQTSPFLFCINNSMVQINALSRQPTELDYADPTKFKFSINKLPKVEFFTTSCNLPGINLGEAVFPTPLKQIAVMGDDLTFDNLEIGFVVDAKLENYIELHNWLLGLGFPKSRNQFSSFKDANTDAFPTQAGTLVVQHRLAHHLVYNLCLVMQHLLLCLQRIILLLR